MKKQFCPYGHDTFVVGRDVTGTCKKCVSIRAVNWQKANREKARVNWKTHYVNNKETRRGKLTSWREQNRGKVKAQTKRAYKKNREAFLEKARVRRHTFPDKVQKTQTQWRRANPEKARRGVARWASQNKFRRAANEAKRRARQVMKFGQQDISAFYKNCPLGMVVDHKVPLQGELVSGLHVIWNLQYLSAADNSRKKHRFDGTLENTAWKILDANYWDSPLDKS